MSEKELNVTLKRSTIGCSPVQRRTVKALGLKRIDSSVTKKATPQIMGMLKKVNHLVEITELNGEKSG